MPKISIITSTYGNASETLEYSLHSILNQHYTDYEVILVNDGDNNSKNTAIIKYFLSRHKNLLVIHNSNNTGLTMSLNRALEFSKGDIIVRHDIGDYSFPERLTEIEKFFLENPYVDIVGSYAYEIDDIKIARDVKKANSTVRILKTPCTHEEIAKALLYDNCLIHPTIAFRRKVIDEIGFYNENFIYAQDYEFFLRALKSGLKFGVIPKPLIAKAYNRQSISVSKRKKQVLYALAAKALFLAKSDYSSFKNVFYLLPHFVKLIIPDYIRLLRHKLGR